MNQKLQHWIDIIFSCYLYEINKDSLHLILEHLVETSASFYRTIKFFFYFILSTLYDRFHDSVELETFYPMHAPIPGHGIDLLHQQE